MDLTWERFKWLAFAVALILAAGGVYWYVRSPGVGSYQASSLLTLPAVLMALVWLHGRLPMWLQWVGASVICLIGPAGYVIVGGDQWWNWGQLTPVPLLLLALVRGYDEDQDDDGYPVVADAGGWGPP